MRGERIDLSGNEVVERLREIAHEWAMSGRDESSNALDEGVSQLIAEYGYIAQPKARTA